MELDRAVPWRSRRVNEPGGKITEILHAAVTRGALPGAVALAVNREGTLFEAAAEIPPDTIFWLASMTKAIVSVAAMQLVEQGRLQLDAPVKEILPALAAPHVLEGFDPDGTPRLRPARTAMTLRHLLSHSAGYGYNFWNPALGRYLDQAGLPPIPTTWDEAARTPLLFDPGTRWTYGINTDIVGLAVEAASGQTLDAYLRAHVLEPLGMHDTGFLLTPAQRTRLARMHRRDAGGRLAADRLGGRRRPGLRRRRRQPVRHGSRLRALPAHAAERRHAGRGAPAGDGHGGGNGPQPYRRPAGAHAGHRDAEAHQRRQLVPRHGAEMGARLPAQQRRRDRMAAAPAVWPGRAWATAISGSIRHRALPAA